MNTKMGAKPSWSWYAGVLWLLLASGNVVMAQGPTEPSPVFTPDPEASLLGRSPGDARINSLDTNPANQGMVGAAPGQSAPRVPTSITQPGTIQVASPPSSALSAPTALPITDLPVYGPLDLPTLGEVEYPGPETGLTLDAAIEQLVTSNVELRSRAMELPQADADILTAGLRSNPFLYYDTQLIPYGKFDRTRPGGQTQYDLNVTFPIDISGKRKARVRVAVQARRVLEAQYQDAVRILIDDLYRAYVDALTARETVRYAQASYESFDRVVSATDELYKKGSRTLADLNRVKIQRSASKVGLEDSKAILRKNKQQLITLLSLELDDPDQFDLNGLLRPPLPPMPDYPTLLELAYNSRPDVQAFRIGIERAFEDVRLARANRFSDVYLLYQPYTLQDNRPEHLPGANSWAIGVTVPLPIFNRNQGNIARARLNVDQTRLELEAVENQLKKQVFDACEEFRISEHAINTLEQEILPASKQVRDDTFKLFTAGELELASYLAAQREYNDAVRQYRDSMARLRRASLSINTVVGSRIVP